MTASEAPLAGVRVDRLVRLWEPLEPLKPFLEFFDGKQWVPSGIITGTCSPAFVGRYRISKPNTRVKPRASARRLGRTVR